MPPIRKQNRTYKKGAPFRDARKFILICEGEREAEYFDFFDKLSQKLIVKTIAPIDDNMGQSAPNHLRDRASEYIEENGWEENYDDQLWFVLDVDRWDREKINELHHLTEITKNWFLAISNICFEVWLYYHMNPTKIEPETSGQMKRILNDQTSGGYNLNLYAPAISTAIGNSANIDNNEAGFYPANGVTKVYKLAMEVVNLLSFENGILKIEE